ncbi:N-acetylgalactosamine-N, N'-diacetylbacillosaminyl-diphospho-undecaprenol 4-alpha-N-acetylgalactosaminyltransferase [Thalassocella blandensis]|nr:N-acetylgalactosamine-N, N'-diacetylbacillosaminyl-diphospho-undecaprenol 4-alpha-N-acetylgalactosaminyltransferase [Thalassocella blandensis]
MIKDRLPERVAFVCHKLDGGIGRNILRLSRDFSSRGIQVEIWSAEKASAFPKELPEGVKFKHLTTSHPVTGVVVMLKLIKSFKPEVIITPSERFTRIVYRAKKLLVNPPAIISCIHNYYSLLYQNLPAKKQIKRRQLLSSIYPKIDAVISVSEGAGRDFRKYANLPNIDISTIYNPIYDGTVKKSANTDIPAGLDLNSPIIVNVGNIVEQKNHLFLIESFIKLREMEKCSLVIVGEGNTEALEAALEASEFKNDVHFVGHQTDPYSFIEISKVFAFTSHYEGFGNVVVESLLFGTPVVSTNSGGPCEILVNEELGQVVDTDNPDVFAETLKEWLGKNIDRKQLIDHAKKHYSVSTIADEYLQLIRAVLKN